MAKDTKVTLYEFPRTRSARCRWTLQELGVPFEAILVDLANAEHRSAEFLAINPNGKVPVLRDGDLLLFESMAICVHLAQKHSQAGLLPGPGTAERALHDQWLFFCATELEQPLWRIRRHTALYPKQRRLPAEIALASEDFAAAARVLEVAMKGKPHLVTDRLTVADIVTAYTLRWAAWSKLLAGFPALEAYAVPLINRPACPDELKF